MEDYEKKYKEALTKAREIHRNEDEKRSDMEWLFPELKESEDERIRKALVRFHKSTIDIDGIKGADILAWLEKQGEQKPIDYNKELKKCRENPLYFFDKYVKLEKQKPACSEEDEKIRREIIDFINRVYECQALIITDEEKDNWIAWLEKQGESYTKKDVDDAYLKGISDAKNELELLNEEYDHWKDVRERAAIAAMQGTITILSSSDRSAFREIVVEGFSGTKKTYPNEIAEFAIACADELVKRLKGNGRV